MKTSAPTFSPSHSPCGVPPYPHRFGAAVKVWVTIQINVEAKNKVMGSKLQKQLLLTHVVLAMLLSF
ncbi:hypothetical protein BRADI_3g15837v3 [Brachypodium distachyon]|uniref:Uncharacterized protein n=1 Tax=Brachypodium distachyon TaxID=15368 RepID=A0A2K2CXE6_BRADI|nr:hypothetical protein BRADI_3g15837v3 [Brachypodium distachyon]